MRLAVPHNPDHATVARTIFVVRQVATLVALVAFGVLSVVFEQEWIDEFLGILAAFWVVGFVPWALAAGRVISSSAAIHAIITIDILFIAVAVANTPDPAQLSAAFFAVITAASVAFRARAAFAYVVLTIVSGLVAVAWFGDRDGLVGIIVSMVMLAVVSIVLIGLRHAERDTRRQLEGSERQLQRAEEVAQIGSWQWQPASGELVWSRNMFRLLGRDPDGPQPDFETWSGELAPDRLEQLTSHVRETLTSGKDYEFDSTHEQADGSRHTIQARGSRVTGSDGSTWLVGTAQDVTELRRVDEIKDEFVATASHELRTPATIVLGAVRTLDDLWEQLDDETRRELVRHLRDGSERMSRLIEDVLSVSRIEHGALKVKPEPVALAPLVENVVASLDEERIEIHVDDAAREAEVLADADRLRQVLINLVENALRYDESGSGVRVEVAASIDGSGAGEALVRVIDRGPGVAADERERIFRRFVRGTASRATSTDAGTGLGLYLARSLVERQGGVLWVEDTSASSTGSAFCFTVPLVSRPAAQR